MYCRSCETLLPANARVCPNCGEANPAFASATESLTFETPILAHTDGNLAEGLASPPAPTAPRFTLPTKLQPTYADPLTPTGPPVQKPPRRLSRTLMILIPILILALIGTGLLIYNVNGYATNQSYIAGIATATTQQTKTAEAQATAAVENPYTQSGKLVFTDPMRSSNANPNWDVNTNCAFKDGAYHVVAPNPHYSDYCTANATKYGNFAFEIAMKIVAGDAGGILLRIENTDPNQYYDFYVGQNGTYGFEVANGAKFSILKEGRSAAIHQGLNAQNVLGVVAQGTDMTLYVNRQRVSSVTDQSYDSGQIGVYAVVYSHPTEVVFSNARLWTI